MTDITDTDIKDEAQAVLIVTGLSGAGMSSTLKHLEDMGYEVFDNLPIGIAESLVHDPASAGRAMAIGIDARTRGFDPGALSRLVKRCGARLLFMTAEETILQNRFTETRRRHPLAQDRPVSAGIRKEQELLFSLREQADVLIDTSMLSIHDLRRILDGHFAMATRTRLAVTVMSFGYKHGLPREADIVMDIRFLQNPHWVPELKPLTGKDKAVGDYIEKDEAYASFINNFKSLIAPLLPRYVQEGKSYLTIAIGCSGGRHRSVYTVEKLAQWLKSSGGHDCNIFHRDLSRHP